VKITYFNKREIEKRVRGVILGQKYEFFFSKSKLCTIIVSYLYRYEVAMYQSICNGILNKCVTVKMKVKRWEGKIEKTWQSVEVKLE
jgi:hypothetical protein